jgi:hypothetical protein
MKKRKTIKTKIDKDSKGQETWMGNQVFVSDEDTIKLSSCSTFNSDSIEYTDSFCDRIRSNLISSVATSSTGTGGLFTTSDAIFCDRHQGKSQICTKEEYLEGKRLIRIWEGKTNREIHRESKIRAKKFFPKNTLLSEFLTCGVYLLFNQGEIIYIGQSKNSYSRIVTHMQDKIFDSFRILNCKQERLLYWETCLISKYKPKLNIKKNFKGVNND